MSMLRKRVEALLPGKDIKVKRARVSRLVGELSTYGREANQAQAQLGEAVVRAAAGDDIDLVAYARAYATARADAVATGEAITILNGYNQQLAAESDSINRADTAAALSYLREELAGVVEEVASLDLTLGSVSSPSAAIKQGFADQWGRLEDLVATYDEIRRLQAEIYSSVAGVEGHAILPLMGDNGLLADALIRDGNVLRRRLASAQNSPNHYENEDAWRRWLLKVQPTDGLPARERDSDWWPEGDRVDYLRRICTTATPWLPDLDTLEDAAAALGGAVQPTNGSGRTAHLEDARARYAAVTGTDAA